MSLAVTALTAAGKFGLARLMQYAQANEFDRLCELLAKRFATLSPLGPAEYAAFVESDPCVKRARFRPARARV